MVSEWAYDASTQDRPDSSPPRPISSFGPNRSTSQPWNGEKKVCRTISSENVTPSVVPSGLVNSVQTYCGLKMAIMQTRPSPSWTQRVGHGWRQAQWRCVHSCCSVLPVTVQTKQALRHIVTVTARDHRQRAMYQDRGGQADRRLTVMARR